MRLVDAFENHGYVVLEGIFDPTLTSEMLRICMVVLAQGKPIKALPHTELRREPYTRFSQAGIVAQVVETLAGNVCYPDRPGYIRVNPVDSEAGPIHRDSQAGGLPIVEVAVFLTPFEQRNGATQIWPDSRKIGAGDPQELALMHKAEADMPPNVIHGPCGSLLFRDDRAWHRAGANLSTDPRVMLVVH